MNTHYDTLGVTRTAPPEVIKAAYRALSQKWHPDKNKSVEAPMRMRELNNAWAILSDAKARVAYDNELATTEGHPRASTRPQPDRPKTQEKEWVSKPFVVDEVLLHKALHPPRSYDWIFSLLIAFALIAVFILIASIIG